MHLKKKICALALAGGVAVCGMGMGYAAWRTTITGTGGASAAGRWDVAVTDARISRLSNGASLGSESAVVSGCAFRLREGISQEDVAAAVAAKAPGVPGAPAQGEKLGSGFYVLDTHVYSVGDMAALRLETVAADPTGAIDLSARPRYCRIDAEGNSHDAAVVSALLKDIYEMVAGINPAEELHDHYALVYLAEDPARNVLYACTQPLTDTAVTDTETSFADGSVRFASVRFSQPDSWAEYTVTVTNSGTVDAVLDDNSIRLKTVHNQLELKSPTLSSDVLEPGESCTFTFTVQAKADNLETLNDTGTLFLSLSYTQPTVESLPDPTFHIHN